MKGATFERLVAARFREAFPASEWKRALQSDGAFNSDVHCFKGHGVFRSLWIECNHSNNPPVEAKLQQAERDAARVEPPAQVQGWREIVVWRKTGSSTINVTMRLRTFLELSASHIQTFYCSYEWENLVTIEWDGFIELLTYLTKEMK